VSPAWSSNTGGENRVSNIFATIVLSVSVIVALTYVYLCWAIVVARRGPTELAALSLGLFAGYTLYASWCVAAVAAFGTTLALIARVSMRRWSIALAVALTPMASLYLLDLLHVSAF